MSDTVQKLWGFCHTPRHDGVDYGDYIEQMMKPDPRGKPDFRIREPGGSILLSPNARTCVDQVRLLGLLRYLVHVKQR
jgi:hypothetical protein